MSDKQDERYSVSDLFMQAARRLKKEFDYVRDTNPHAATKGSEAEKVLRKFLNEHLPQRFRATTGILIDNANSLSKQSDVIIYDSLSSPVYKYSEDAMILPVDTVASVIEVKSRLTSEELLDGYEKIASVKTLKKKPSSQMDVEATGSDLKMAATLGVIFAFTSDITIETAAKKAAEFNEKFDSHLWPDMVVILDVGTLNYVIRSPGNEIFGDLMPREENFAIIPFYVNLFLRKDGEFSLNRFFVTLLSHLQFFPHRPSVPPFEIALEKTTKEGIGISSYQYDRNKKLLPLSRSTIELPASIQIKSENGEVLAVLHWIPWPSGGAIMREGKAPLEMFLVLAGFAKDTQIFHCGEHVYSSVLPVTRADFLNWPRKLNPKMKGMTAEVVIHKAKNLFDEGTSTPYIARLTIGMYELAKQTLSPEFQDLFSKSYPMQDLLDFRKLVRELNSQTSITDELTSAILNTSLGITKKVLNLMREMGTDVSFLLYRDQIYLKRLEKFQDHALAKYIKQHRDSWATVLSEYAAAAQTNREEKRKKTTRTTLEAIYNGVAKLIEEIAVYTFQQNALAGLKIMEIDKANRDPGFARRFRTDLIESWQVNFNPVPFDEL